MNNLARPTIVPTAGFATWALTSTCAILCAACVSPAAGDLAVGPIPRTPSTVAVAIEKLTRDTCGATWSTASGNRSGSDLYAVSVYFEAGRSQEFNHFPSAGELERFIVGNHELLGDKANNVGTYCEHDRGDCKGGSGAMNCYVEISRTTKDLARAAALATACNQKSIAFLGKDGVRIVESYQGRPFGDGRTLDERQPTSQTRCASVRAQAAPQ